MVNIDQQHLHNKNFDLTVDLQLIDFIIIYCCG